MICSAVFLCWHIDHIYLDGLDLSRRYSKRLHPIAFFGTKIVKLGYIKSRGVEKTLQTCHPVVLMRTSLRDTSTFRSLAASAGCEEKEVNGFRY